jgi:hypothetical protein
MGAKAARKKLFLAAHRFCCFCGGMTPSATEDHVPPRVIFHGRVWPEGFAFPACDVCNSVTRYREQVIGLLARLHPDTDTEDPTSVREFRNLLAGLRNNQRDVFLELKPTANETKAFLRKRGLKLPPGMTANEYPLLSLKGPIVKASVKEFARKLFLALHYKEAGKIVPDAGGLMYRWWSNIQVNEGKFPHEQIFELVNRFPNVKRGNRNFLDQFAYRYGVSDDGALGAYAARFSGSFVMFGIVALDEPTLREADADAVILKPFPASVSVTHSLSPPVPRAGLR